MGAPSGAFITSLNLGAKDQLPHFFFCLN